jgi:hypothetical protein
VTSAAKVGVCGRLKVRVKPPDFFGARNERSSHIMHKLSHKTKVRQIRQTRQNRRHHLKRKAHRHRQKLASLNND